MNPFTLLFLYSLLLVWLPLAGAVAQDQDAARVLLSSQGLEITAGDLDQALLALPPGQRQAVLADPAQIRSLLGQVYRDQRLLASVAALGLEQSPEVQARLRQARLKVLSDALRRHWEAGLATPDFAALAREGYQSRQAEFIRPAQYRLAHILRRADCECERAEQRALLAGLQVRLAAGEDFADLAKAYSQDTGVDASGDAAQWVDANQLDKSIAEALAALADGGVSGPLESRVGVHLIRRLEYRPATLVPFEEVQAQLENEVRTSYVRNYLKEVMTGYLPGEEARYEEEAIRAWREQQP